MFKKILVIFGLIATCVLLSGYFYCAERYTAKELRDVRCTGIDVVICNSQAQNFISEGEVADMVRRSVMGMKMGDINTFELENRLCASSAICKVEAYIQGPSNLVLEVTQRIPVARFQREDCGFYCDSSGYVLPLLGKVIMDLPVVSGKLPFKTPASLSGYPDKGREWLLDMLRLTETIRNNSYWSREIEQIWVEDNTDVVLYANSCDERFILGSLDDIDTKLDKMAGYMRTIKPMAKREGKVYKTINLKYKDQIICK